jgi:hypothetical protein
LNNFDNLMQTLEEEHEALRVWLSNEQNAKPEVVEGVLISRRKIYDALNRVRQERE